jgi:hypothetical protein
MDSARRRALIEQYKDGYRAVRAALDQLSEEELDARPAEGWTPREIAHHLADSETMSYIRLRRLVAEDHPVIQGYDEPEYARRLHYDRPITSSLEVFRAVRAASAELLESLGEDEWRVRARTANLAVTPWTTGWRSTPPTRTTTPRKSSAFICERGRLQPC